MRRSLVVLFSATLVLGLPAPGRSSHNHHDHSANVTQVSSARIMWDEQTEKDPVDLPIYLSDLSFEGRLMVGAVVGHQKPVRPSGENPESGIGLFHLGRRGQVDQIGQFRCYSFGEISVWGDLVLQGVIESQEAHMEPGSQGKCDREGLRIIDISNPARPKEVGFVPMPCGVGDHAIAARGGRVYVYVPSTCDDQTDNPFSAGFFADMTVVRIEPGQPPIAEEVGFANLLPLNGCGEVSVFAKRNLAVCAGFNLFALLDISDRANPKVIPGSFQSLSSSIQSLTFSWDGQMLALGHVADGRSEDPTVSVELYNIEDVTNLVKLGTWTVPPGPGWDNATYSLSFVPMRGARQVLTVAHGTRGLWLLDVSDPQRPRAFGHYVPMDTTKEYVPTEEPSAIVSTHFYEGLFYAADMGRVRTFRVRGISRRNTYSFEGRYNPNSQTRSFD